MLEDVLSELFYVVERIDPQRWEDVYVNRHYLNKGSAAIRICFLPVSGPLSTRQFLLFTSLRWTWMFYCLTLILLKDKKKSARQKWDLVGTQETPNCNMLITLFLSLLMSNIEARDDLRRKRKKKNTEEEWIRFDVHILAEHSGNHCERSNTKSSALDRCLWGGTMLLQLPSHEAF